MKFFTDDINEDLHMQAVTYDIQSLELVEETLEEVIRTNIDEMTQLAEDYGEIEEEKKLIVDSYKKREDKIIKALIQVIAHQLVMQHVNEQHLLLMLLHGPQENLSGRLFDKQRKEQIEKEILAEFRRSLSMPSQVTDAIVLAGLEEVIKEKLACSLRNLDKQASKQSMADLLKNLNSQGQKQSQQKTANEEKLNQLWNRWSKDHKRECYQDKQRQISHQYFQRRSLIEDAVSIQEECQQPVLTAYNYVSIVTKEVLSIKQQTQKLKRDRYYLKIACYMAMLSRDTTKSVSDFMYHACKNYV